MSITALANLDVTSVTKSAGALGDAPASIYVITHDDIVRSGSLTLPGILRLAPNLQISRGGSTDLLVSARGLSGNSDAQNFSNKLLVLIDGRSVYTPLYSGVYWDMQDVLPEDVERIEVISGPGATLWGANAVNGVINIITRNAGASQGLYGTGVIGTTTYDLGLRYGGHAGESFNYRLFVKRHKTFDSDDGAHNGNVRTQGGFRIDWSPTASDVLMLQGDGYSGDKLHGTSSPDEHLVGYDVVGSWRRTFAGGSTLQAQLYYDHAARWVDSDQGRFDIDTFDADLQHSFALGGGHQIVWGGGARFVRYKVEKIPNILVTPDQRTLSLANLFAQDSIAITPTLTGIVGLKLEDGAYSGIEMLPTARFAWKPDEGTLIWGAVSRAIRSPTPFDRDIEEFRGGALILTALTTQMRSEKVTAFELGTRLVLSKQASLSVSGFYNLYDDLRTIEPTPGVVFPLRWDNGMEGDGYGLDAWADLRVTDWWRLKPGYSLLIEKFRFKPGASGLLGVAQAGNDPRHRATLRSSMDLGPVVNFDADLRFVGALPSPFTPSYVELGARLGWQFMQTAELSVSGFNLLHDNHLELPASQAKPIGRSVFVALKWSM